MIGQSAIIGAARRGGEEDDDEGGKEERAIASKTIDWCFFLFRSKSVDFWRSMCSCVQAT
jgi:hypothetical protein